MTVENYDIIVIGAGVAGGVFAASQSDNRKILVIERDLSEKERIVGELMQPDGLIALNNLGLSHLTENIDAQIVHGYKLIKSERNFKIEYKEIDNKISGLGLRNGKLLNNIQTELKRKNNITLIQGNVTELTETDSKITGVTYTDHEGNKVSVSAALTVVSDGHMSFFRKQLSKPNKNIESYFMGLVLKDLNLENPAHGHMIISGEAPILVYPIHSNGYRILVDYPGEKPPRMGTKSMEEFKNTVSALLPEEMKASFLAAIADQQVMVMPNHRMKAQAFRKKGAVLLGDSLNMRHPLTGGGMTASFNDIITLNEALNDVDLSNESETELAIQTYYKKRSAKVETINILANALYKVFRDNDLKDACFDYLEQGGEKATGPLSILAGINKNKKYLLKHFFKVAMQHPLHFVTKPRKQIRLYKNAVAIITPILRDEEKPAMV